MAKKREAPMPIGLPMPKRTSTCRLSLDPEKSALTKALQDVRVGKSVRLEVVGRVASLSQDKYEHALTLDVTAVDVEPPTMGEQLEELRESRRQKG